MRAVVAACALAACGRPAAPPVAVAPVHASPRPAEVTCGDAGVILRGHVEDQRAAGPAKEAAIASACLHDRWAPEVLHCVGTQPRAKPCLERLAAEQKAGYDKKLAAWNELFPDEMLEETYDEQLDGDSLDDDVDCSDAVHDVELFAPPIAAAGDDRELAISLREHALISLCGDGWSNTVRACFRDTGQGPVDACRGQLERDQHKAMTDKLADLDQLIARIAVAKKKPPTTYDCRHVAAAHYGDPAWQGKLESLKGAARAKVVAESRTKMLKSCTDDKWSPTMRACVVAGGGDSCFGSLKLVLWGFPAAGIVIKTGIPECDAYGAAVTAVGKCDKLPQSSRDSLLQSFTLMNQSWVNLPADARKSAAGSCRQGEEAIRQIAASVGCKL